MISDLEVKQILKAPITVNAANIIRYVIERMNMIKY